MSGELALTLEAAGKGGIALRRPNGDPIPNAPHVRLTGQCTNPKSDIVHDPDGARSAIPLPHQGDCNLRTLTTLTISFDRSLPGAKFVAKTNDGYIPFCINRDSKTKDCINQNLTSAAVLSSDSRSVSINIDNLSQKSAHVLMDNGNIKARYFSINWQNRDGQYVSLDPMIPNKPHFSLYLLAMPLGGVMLAAMFSVIARKLITGRQWTARSSWVVSIMMGIVFAFAALCMISQFIDR